VAPQVGLEPTTGRLTADCSTAELLRNVQEAPTPGEPGLHRGHACVLGPDQLYHRPPCARPLANPGQRLNAVVAGIGNCQAFNRLACEHNAQEPGHRVARRARRYAHEVEERVGNH
jgi:hypothetical protein